MKRTSSTVLVAAMAGAALLAGCERSDNRTESDRRESVVASNEPTVTAGSSLREAGRDATDAAGKAVDGAVDKARDATITTEINMLLARDSDLGALGIDVDTAGGRVVLRGNAPDPTARERATQLARGVSGVVAVNNELQVQPRN